MKRAEVFSIGDELLRGIVADTNSHWIIQRLTARGTSVQRATMLGDTPSVVAAALGAALERGVDLVVTHGGLGPTDDDRTREALGLAAGVPCEPHAGAEAIVRRRYAELAESGAVAGAEITPARARMWLLPRGADALDNQVGAAPGVVLRLGSTTIVSLPGVPPEMHWIFEGPLAPVLDDVLGPGGFAEWTGITSTTDESSIAGILIDVQGHHRGVYVKSRAKSFGADQHVRVTLSAAAQNDAEARGLIESARRELVGALEQAGVKVAAS